ncbi:DUF3095 family protein [Flavitalea antarctica]
MKLNTDLFYTQIAPNSIGIDDLLSNEELFIKVPSDWHIVITDIKDSTHSVLNGEHEKVNVVATGSIVTVLNIAYKMSIDVPFFFGGDGASFIVPPVMISPVMQALFLYKERSLANFNLEIRTGTITVKKVYSEGYELNISKYSRSSVFSMPVMLGNGLNYAEGLIKGVSGIQDEYLPQGNELDLSGMECRWDRIAPPENQEEVVALLVIARRGFRQSSTFRNVMQKLDEIYGSAKQRQPISILKLRRQTTYKSIRTELIVKFGRFRLIKFIQAQIAYAYRYIYLRTKNGKRFLRLLVEMANTLVIDGKISTVISGTASQREKLEAYLTEMELTKKIFYGLHISSASIMSCYVRNTNNGHIHFVDGSEGGYTQASRIIKSKLTASNLQIDTSIV